MSMKWRIDFILALLVLVCFALLSVWIVPQPMTGRMNKTQSEQFLSMASEFLGRDVDENIKVVVKTADEFDYLMVRNVPGGYVLGEWNGSVVKFVPYWVEANKQVLVNGFKVIKVVEQSTPKLDNSPWYKRWVHSTGNWLSSL